VLNLLIARSGDCQLSGSEFWVDGVV